MRSSRLGRVGLLSYVAALLVLTGCGDAASNTAPSTSGGSESGGSGGSSSAAVGATCVPAAESQADFSGESTTETSISIGNPGCPSSASVCVAVGFQGRVSCPYGQASSDLTLPSDDPKRCRVPDRDGKPTSAPVTVKVAAQLIDRQAKDAVFCSCRCAGPDASATCCECPSGATCTELVPSLSLGPPSETAGSYCVPAGIGLKGDASGPTCSAGNASCGGAARNP